MQVAGPTADLAEPRPPTDGHGVAEMSAGEDLLVLGGMQTTVADVGSVYPAFPTDVHFIGAALR
jgi:hypothetical protein